MNGLETRNFLYVYENTIAPKLKEIDLTVRTKQSLGKREVCRLLDISEGELDEIFERSGIKKTVRVDRKAFFKIMQYGKSQICSIFRREVECGAPFTYDKEKIAYIYNLNPDDVSSACERLGIAEATAMTLPLVFAQIPVCTASE